MKFYAVIVLAVIFQATVTFGTYSLKPACNTACCKEKCKTWFSTYWQRFCGGKHIKIWCYKDFYLKIVKAQYGNFPCTPSGTQYTGNPMCQATGVTEHAKKRCDYQNICTGYANNNLLGGGHSYAFTCAYSYVPSFWAKYQCRPTERYCSAYCKCKTNAYSDTYCRTNYYSYMAV